MKNAMLVPVQFHGDTLEAVRDDDGRVWVSIRRVCDALGIDACGQHFKLKNKSWAVIEKFSMTAADGKRYETLAILLDGLPMWLATIESRKVAEHIRPKLERYQAECYRVLAEHFLGKPKPDQSAEMAANGQAMLMIAKTQETMAKNQELLIQGQGQIVVLIQSVLAAIKSQTQPVPPAAPQPAPSGINWPIPGSSNYARNQARAIMNCKIEYMLEMPGTMERFQAREPGLANSIAQDCGCTPSLVHKRKLAKWPWMRDQKKSAAAKKRNSIWATLFPVGGDQPATADQPTAPPATDDPGLFPPGPSQN